MPDWEDLHAFLVFMRLRSLSAAARELGVEHATVARRIAALEAGLKVKLVDRRSRIYVPTADGEEVARLGEQMEAQAFAISRRAETSKDVSGEVSISSPPMLTLHLIAPALARLHLAFPALRLHVLTETRKASLHQREADIALRLSRPSESSIVVRKLGDIRFGLYAAPGYLASTAPASRVFLGYDESMEQSPQQQWLRDALRERDIALRSNSLEVQHAVAAGGFGIVGLPWFVGDVDSRLARVDDGEPALVRQVWLAVHEDLRHVPRVDAVAAFLGDVLGKALAAAS